MSLLNWVNTSGNVPENKCVARRNSLGSFVNPSLTHVNCFQKLSYWDKINDGIVFVPLKRIEERINSFYQLVGDTVNRVFFYRKQDTSLCLLDISSFVIRIKSNLNFQVHSLTVHGMLASMSELNVLSFEPFASLVIMIANLCIDPLQVLTWFVDSHS
jgi:hypothetical protein